MFISAGDFLQTTDGNFVTARGYVEFGYVEVEDEHNNVFDLHVSNIKGYE